MYKYADFFKYLEFESYFFFHFSYFVHEVVKKIIIKITLLKFDITKYIN